MGTPCREGWVSLCLHILGYTRTHARAYAHTRTPTHAQIQTHAHTHARTRTPTHAQIHTHTHTHAHAHTRPHVYTRKDHESRRLVYDRDDVSVTVIFIATALRGHPAKTNVYLPGKAASLPVPADMSTGCKIHALPLTENVY